MTILTKKFSEFTSGGDLENSNVTVGLESSANTQFNNPWTFLPPGNTGDRPPIAPPMFDRLRFNTTFEEYEYYNSGTAAWVQLNNTGTIAGPFVIYEADAALPTAFNLGTLTTGLLKQTVSLGVSTPATALLDTDYYGPGMSGYMQAPAGMKDGTGAIIFSNIPVVSAVNYLTFSNNVTLNNPILGAGGTDSNIGVSIRSKGTAPVSFETAGSSPAYTFRSGTSMLHVTNFIMTNTIHSVDVTWQDASGTVAYLTDIPAGSPSALTKVDDTNVTLTLGGTPATALLQAVSLTLGWTGTLSETRGGTNQSTYTLGDTLYASAANTLSKLSGNTTAVKQYLSQTGTGVVSAAPVWATISGGDITGAALTKTDDTNVTLSLGGTPTTALLRAASLTLGWTGTLSVSRGGLGQGATPSTGQIPYGGSSIYTPTSLTAIIDASIGSTQGNILYRNASSWVVLAPGVNGQLLQSLGPAANIQWVTSSTVTPNALTKVDDTNVTLTLGGTPASALLQPVSLTLGWTGTLAATRGGTGQSTYATGDILYASAANTLSKLAGNITTAKQYLSQTGSGAASAAPVWATISGADITGAALTKTDDTNVTLTLGGSPTTALLNATSLTLGWAGQLGLTRGGTNASLTASNGGIFYSTATAGAILSGTATAQQLLLSGASTTPQWSTSTYPLTNAVSTLLYASSANVMAALATANSSILVTNSSGVPAWGTTLPAFTTSAITFSPTTGGIVGTTTNDDAAAGKVGEYLTNNASAVSTTTSTAKTITSVSLTAGDWDVWGYITYLPASGTLPTSLQGCVSSTDNATEQNPSFQFLQLTFPASARQDFSLAPVRKSLSTTTTIYLVASNIFTVSTMTCNGTIVARRRR